MIKINLKKILEEKDISIKEIYEKTGISRNTLSMMANGKTTGIQFDTLEKLLSVLDCEIEELIIYNQQNFHFGFILPHGEFENLTKNKNYKKEAYLSFGFNKNHMRKITFSSSMNNHGIFEVDIIDDESYSNDDYLETELEHSIGELKQIMHSNHYMYDLFSYLLIYNLELCNKLSVPLHTKYISLNIEKLSFLNKDKIKPRYLVPTPDEQSILTLMQYKNFIEDEGEYRIFIKHDETMVSFEVINFKE